MDQVTRPPPALPDIVTAPAQFYTTEVIYKVLHGSNCHTLAHVYLAVSAGKLRPRGGVTGAGVSRYLGSASVPELALVKCQLLRLSKGSVSECPAGWPYGGVQAFSLSGAL